MGEYSIKHADFISGGASIKMIVRLTGEKRVVIKTPVLIFNNATSSYPIRRVLDKVPGVCYRKSSKTWKGDILLH